MKKLAVAILMTTMLTACTSRDQVDQRLARGCEAGVKAVFEDERFDRQITAIKGKEFSPSTIGNAYRQVTLKASTKNKQYGYENDEDFVCIFNENYGFGYMMYKATLHQLKIGTETFGSDGAQILGSMEDHMKIVGAVEAAIK